MKLIVGLGNPGEKYQYTRHNIGFMVVEKFVKDRLPLAPSLNAWKSEKKLSTEICKLKDCIVIKPQTFMNLSGMAVVRISSFYKIKNEDIFVVHDDIDLPLGKIRIRKGGASAGHRGIDSIIKNIGSDNFVRFRLGIGRGKLNVNRTTDQNLHRRDVEKYVVSLFNEHEGSEVKHLVKNASEALEIVLDKGMEKAMNRFN
ncbi:aminoacyl-tRNA hydrolase [Candidatus Gottesmanbacteria bacterium RIFCSPHIGHO2_01_FULL_39_10]|uniref:Peptidyl-tRNA hydrolase n=1 Tax=Candidatus Gottesmanbacteria bacterium RIFCSPHIGHO2_01_FULL_39_10 TaxID=1798375 RepID=A0A1F5ZR67_9BACT|nr:MAG: aminoacyl-tRNA hydrolase [Candidatus Gottesmanbacteria bacterium RIFCSPHIGHO2_01_FULL_39_10]